MRNAKRIIITVLVLVVAFGAVGYVLSNNKKQAEEKTRIVAETNASVAVRVDTVKLQPLAQNVSANGVFAPIQELNFSSEKAGRIVQVLAKEGSYVNKGQVLATIRVDQLSVELQSAEAAYQNALAEKERFEKAYATGGVTKQQLDQVQLSLTNAKARLDQTKINVNDATIRATISGVINKRHIEPGSVVAPGTALFEIVNVSKLKLNVTVNESQVARLKVGQTIKITASVFPDKTFAGRVTFISAKADQSLNFPVEIEVTNNAGGELKAGMYGTAHLDFGTDVESIVVPRSAFVGSVSSNQVFVVNSDKAQLRTVTAGRVLGDRVEVLSGLNAGELVITSGQINLSDGTAINIIR